ncbi:hypothetical protein IMSHALPRED_006986 [Imshaugia aleurites]|uniref:Uncharacterized protein n=1 Tax=Imshaugia aleurites TaxID=172621 RepID=A0A8H3IML7_9LECA|nr:hypothetical protein IMSHALPRED_006986 [Imshaugia aleurites]
MSGQTPRTPASSRSIIRSYSPYCESTGPIVQEGFVAARIRALQGFSSQAQIPTPTPPQRLHIYKQHSPPKPSIALKPVLSRTVRRFHTDILSKDHRNLVSVSRRPTRSSGIAPAFQPQELQSSLEPTTPSRLYVKGRGAESPCPGLPNDTVPSSLAQRNRDCTTALSTQYASLSEVDEIDVVPVENSSPSEKAILSPHAIQADLVEPWATWNCLPQTGNRNSDYNYEQALKPRGSIADKLGSLVEQGWMGSEACSKVHYNNRFASHIADSTFLIRDTGLDSRSDPLSEMPHLKSVPSYNRSHSVSTAETLSESQHSTGQDTPPQVKQKQPGTFAYHGSPKRKQRKAKGSPAVSSIQRSSSDSRPHFPKTALADPTKKRRAWTLQHLRRRSASNYGNIQREAYPTIWPHFARDHRGSEQNHNSIESAASRKNSISKSGFDLTMLRDEQLSQDSAALSETTGSRRSSSNTKELTRSASRSTSFFKKFPWYKVALVDKQTVVQDLSKGGRGNDRTSGSTRATQHDPTSDPIELSRGVSKSQTLVERGHDDDGKAPKTQTPPSQGSTDQQAMDAVMSNSTAYSKPSVQLLTHPQAMDERQVLEKNQTAPQRPQGSHATSLKITEERLARSPAQVVTNLIGQAQSPTSIGPSGAQPRIPSQSRSMDANFESPISGDVLQSLKRQWPEVKEHSRMHAYTPSHAKSKKLHADKRPKQSSSGSETARPEEELTTSSNSPRQLRSQAVNLFPKRLGSSTDSLLASVHGSDQHEPVHRELKGRGKGIKKVQVIVTFDGAEDLVIEATLKKKKKNRQEHWRTVA